MLQLLSIFIFRCISTDCEETSDENIAQHIQSLGETFRKAGKQVFNADQILNKINIMIVGITGVGKSTLINNLFGGKFAVTGIGRRITKQIVRLTKKNSPLTIYDTPGLELDSDQQQSLLDSISQLIDEKAQTKDPSKYIHCIWYCINCATSRFEESEIKFIKKLTTEYLHKIPIVIILTQCYNRKDKDDMIEMISSLDLGIPIVPVVSEEKVYDIVGYKDPIVIPSFGLDDLIDVMADCLPEILIETFNNKLFH